MTVTNYEIKQDIQDRIQRVLSKYVKRVTGLKITEWISIDLIGQGKYEVMVRLDEGFPHVYHVTLYDKSANIREV
jgi:hypothetical protein